jgi:hypothetical protein
MKFGKSIPFGVVFRWLACAVYGVIVGYLAIMSADAPVGVIDNSSYQNFAIIFGAVFGLAMCAVAHGIYLVWKRHSKPKRVDPVFVISITTGVIIGFATTFIVHVSADSFGMTNARMGVAITGSIVAAVIGGLLPTVALLLIGHRE